MSRCDIIIVEKGRCEMKQIIEILKRLRQTLGLTQAELAREMKCSRLSLISWETNQATPRTKWLEKWLSVLSAEILKLSADERKANQRLRYRAAMRSRVTKEGLRKYGKI